MKLESQIRVYSKEDSAVFRKTTEVFGGFSNMAAGFKIRVNGELFLTTEALYQACRFPHRPELQKLIIEQHSPMTAKMKAKPYRNDSRADWIKVRVRIMQWCLHLKLAQHWDEFSRLLLSSGDRPIVEDSRNDDFWGAKVTECNTLVGMNVLGRLLMGLREQVKEGAVVRVVPPPSIPNFLLFGSAVTAIDCADDFIRSSGEEVHDSQQQSSIETTLPLFD